MPSGYTLCPCCGYDTVSDDTAQPELCSDCEESGCHHDGSDPQPGCPAFVDDSEIGLGTEYIARAPGACFETGRRYKVVAVYDGRMDLECAALDTTVAGVRIDDPALERVPRA